MSLPVGQGTSSVLQIGFRRRLGAFPGHVVYPFENAFDWRSGPRRGILAAPKPIPTEP
jgi:hypothetical protein